MRYGTISRAVVSLGASGALAVGMLVMAPATPAGADIVGPATVRISAQSGTDGGREQSAMSANGRYTVFVGRSSAWWGVYLYDAQTGATTRLTTGNDMNPAISPDGRYVAYTRYGSNRGVYLLDRSTGATTLESVATGGAPATGGGGSDFASISSGGRYVAFQSMATNLGGPTASGGPNKIYVHDNVTGMTTMVSLTSAGGAPNGNATFPRITPNGRYVAFVSDASNLLPASAAARLVPAASGGGDTGGETSVTQVYVRDLVAGTTTMASVSSTGEVGNGASGATYGPSISDNGRLVAFESDATNLVADDTNGVTDAFVHNMATGTTTRVSVTADGAQATPSPLPEGVTDTTTPLVAGGGPQISGNGSTVAFESEAPLTSDDVNGVMDVYTYDMANGSIERISVPAPGGTEATGTRVEGGGSAAGTTVAQVNGIDASIDVDGRYVSFTSDGDLADDRPLPTETTEASYEPAIFVRTRNVPTVTGITPSSLGQARYGQVVTITGTNFTPGYAPGDLTVNLGQGVTATGVTWVSSTELRATVNVAWNADLGNRVVGVRNPGTDVGSLTSAFSVTGRGTGYRLAGSDGGVFNFGDDAHRGSMGGTRLNAPVVGMADSATGNGYWMVASDGGVFAFGDATFRGSMGGTRLNAPVVGMAATPDGGGYWLVASDGGVFAFGDAVFRGSAGASRLNAPVVGMATTPDGGGYWLVASDGGMFSFGDAVFRGSAGATHLNAPVVGMAASPSGGGYWLVASDGGVFSFGDATFRGSLGATRPGTPVVGIAAVPSGGGYWITTSAGDIVSFGSANYHGGMDGLHLNGPVVAMTAD